MAPSNKHPEKFKDTDRKIPDLPDEISENILLRLPVELLLEYKGVSKSWFALISSKRFVKIHLENSNKNYVLSHLGIISGSNYYLKHCSLQSLLRGPSIDTIDLRLPCRTIYPKRLHRLVGCSNGLCCMMTSGKHFSLLNPCMKEFKRLPDKYCEDGHVTRYGFGFDESDDDYKVFATVLPTSMLDIDRYTKIYSLKTISWKKMEYFDVGGSPKERRGLFLKGKLHWIIDKESRSNITYFDLGSAVHGSLEIPSSVDRCFMSLGVIRECLCFLCYSNNFTNLWICSQDGVKESWMKLASICHLGNPTSWIVSCTTPMPLYISPEGDEILLLIKGSSFVIYYPRLGCFKNPQLSKSMNSDDSLVPKMAFLDDDACVYVESLVSPFFYDEQN